MSTRALNARQRAFLELVAKGEEPHEAYHHAGYNKVTNSQAMLRFTFLMTLAEGRKYFEGLTGKNVFVNTEMPKNPNKNENHLLRPLTHMEFVFCQLVASGVDPNEAYSKAGYTLSGEHRGRYGHQFASRLMSRPNIFAKIEELKQKGEILTAEEIEKFNPLDTWCGDLDAANKWVRTEAYTVMRVLKERGRIEDAVKLLFIVNQSINREFREKVRKNPKKYKKRDTSTKGVSKVVLKHGVTDSDKSKAEEVTSLIERLTEHDGDGPAE